MKGTVENESLTFKLRSIPVPSEQRSRYELLAFVHKKKGLLYREERYVRWDADEKERAKDICLCKGRTGASVACGHILDSGAFVAMHVDAGNRLILCDPMIGTIRSLWDAGWWDEFRNTKYTMYVIKTGSHAVFYGKSNDCPAPDKSSYALCATTLHFNPTILCESDVIGVNDSSLLQRIRLLHGLCLAASYEDEVTLTTRGKELFAQLHSQVRCNLQTTMRKVYGWKEEPATRASRVPILPRFVIKPWRRKRKNAVMINVKFSDTAL